MAGLNATAARWAPQLLSVMRIIFGFTFMAHGTQKLFGYPPSDHGPPPAMFSFMWFGGLLEFVGGLLILIGLFTRPTAFVLSGMMAVAYWMVHGTKAFLPLVNGGELAVVYCFAFLYLAAAGAGPWSVDAAMKRE